MPNLEEHCKHCLDRYGVEGRDIHSWLDEPSKEYAGSHRQFRHDTETIRLVGELFGKTYGKDLAENIALDHIMTDHEQEIKNRNSTIIVNIPKETEMPSIPCGYCKTLLKPSDQSCPKCGASRTKIFSEIDCSIEMEKLKAQEAKKKLRKELKIELEYSELSPLQRMHNLKVLQGLTSKNLLVNHIQILERLVKQDLENDQSLEQKWLNSLTEKQKRALRIR